MDAVPVAAAALDPAGRILAANVPFAALLDTDHWRGEPLLSWVPQARARAAFGRRYRTLFHRGAGRTLQAQLAVGKTLADAVPGVLHVRTLGPAHAVAVFERTSPGAEGGTGASVARTLARTLGALDHGAVLIDGSGRVVEANPAAEKLLGPLSPGSSFLERLPPGQVEAVARLLSLGDAGGVRLEVELRGRGGEPVPVEVAATVGPGGDVPAVILLRDLRQARRRAFEARVAAQVDRALLREADPRRAALDALDAVARAFGACGAFVLVRVGQRWERWSVDDSGAHAADRLASVDPAGPPWGSDGRPLEFRVEAGDPWVGGGFRAGLHGVRVPLDSPRGRVGYVVLVQAGVGGWTDEDLDFFGRLAAQLALGVANGLLTLETRALADYQAMLLDQTSVLIVSLDGEGRVVTWNRASERLLGTAAEQAVGRRFGVDLAPSVPGNAWAAAWERLQRDGTYTAELVLRNADGEDVPLHLEGRRLAAPDGACGAVLVGLDLRTRRLLESQVLRSQKLAAVGVLAAGIAHEINNPLSGVVGYGQLLAERKDLPEDVRDRIRRIVESGERCRRIVEGVLLFSRRHEPGPRRVTDLRELVDRVLRLGEYQWRMRNVRVVRSPNEPVYAAVDPQRIEQVVLNLVANAADAMPRGGTIRVGVGPAGDRARLDVEDAGTGIARSVLPRIFDPFFSTKEVGRGTGLGLAISYGIVEEHGGTIEVESTEGVGTRFSVYLPREDVAHNSQSNAPAAGDGPAPGAPASP